MQNLVQDIFAKLVHAYEISAQAKIRIDIKARENNISTEEAMYQIAELYARAFNSIHKPEE